MQYKELCYSIMLIKYQANSCKSIQQTFIALRVRQYTLIEHSAKYAHYNDMMHCITLIEHSYIVNITGVTGSF